MRSWDLSNGTCSIVPISNDRVTLHIIRDLDPFNPKLSWISSNIHVRYLLSFPIHTKLFSYFIDFSVESNSLFTVCLLSPYRYPTTDIMTSYKCSMWVIEKYSFYIILLNIPLKYCNLIILLSQFKLFFSWLTYTLLISLIVITTGCRKMFYVVLGVKYVYNN